MKSLKVQIDVSDDLYSQLEELAEDIDSDVEFYLHLELTCSGILDDLVEREQERKMFCEDYDSRHMYLALGSC